MLFAETRGGLGIAELEGLDDGLMLLARVPKGLRGGSVDANVMLDRVTQIVGKPQDTLLSARLDDGGMKLPIEGRPSGDAFCVFHTLTLHGCEQASNPGDVLDGPPLGSGP